MGEQAPHSESECVQISIGTVFEVSPSSSVIARTHLIVDIGSDNYFGAAPLLYDENGLPFWRTINVGTAGPEDIGQIIHQMSLDEVIAAGERGAMQDGYSLPDDFITIFRQIAEKGHRPLRLQE